MYVRVSTEDSTADLRHGEAALVTHADQIVRAVFNDPHNTGVQYTLRVHPGGAFDLVASPAMGDGADFPVISGKCSVLNGVVDLAAPLLHWDKRV